MATIAAESPAETRVERKRRETRARIIAEAERLMRTRPMEEITIGDITGAADVGHGTFYLHFKSKHDVLVPIIRAMANHWDQVIQEHLAGSEDPAEVVGLSTRYMGRAVNTDPLWRWMLQHSGMPMDDMRDAIGRFAARDFGRGLLSGRFQVPDLGAANNFLIGGFVTGLLGSFSADDPEREIDNMAELILRTLGIEVSEASRIAHQPLPSLAQTLGKTLGEQK